MTWVGMPVDIVERLERLGLSRDDRLLYVEGFLYAGQYMTDGTVTPRLPRLSDHPDADAAAARLVDAQVWEMADTGAFVIVDYFSANLARDEIARRKEDARVRQERSRRHRAGDHSICIRGRYCPEGQADAVTRDETRDETRESRHTYLPDLPDLPGKVREGKGSAGDDHGRGSPKGSPTPASPPEAASPPHIYADPQRLGHCCHCNLPPRNAAHHPGVPESLKHLAEVASDLGPITPERMIDDWGDSWWIGRATSDNVKWRWETAQNDERGRIDHIEFVLPHGVIPERTDEQWQELNKPYDVKASELRPPMKWECEDDEGDWAWQLIPVDWDSNCDASGCMPMARALMRSVLQAPVQP